MPKIIKSKSTKKSKQSVKQVAVGDLRSYELTIVVSSKVKAESRKGVVSSITKLIESKKGRVAKTEEWGLKDLAYAIDHELSGWYVCLFVSLPPEAIADLDKDLKRDKNILRFLLIKQ